MQCWLCIEMTGTHSIQVAFDLFYSTSEEQEDGSLGRTPATVRLETILIMQDLKKKIVGLILANRGIFFEIWLQQFLCIFNVSFSSACKTKHNTTSSDPCLLLLMVAAACESHRGWSSWRCDSRAAACCKERTGMCFLPSPPQAAEDRTPT